MESLSGIILCYSTGWPQTWKNLEYSGDSLNWETHGILRNSVEPQRKIITNKIFSTIEYLHETAVDLINKIITISGSSNPAQ